MPRILGEEHCHKALRVKQTLQRYKDLQDWSTGRSTPLVSMADSWRSTRGGTRVLAIQAEQPNEVDAKRAELALRRANERLLNPAPCVDIARALNAARQARLRLMNCAGVAPPKECMPTYAIREVVPFPA